MVVNLVDSELKTIGAIVFVVFCSSCLNEGVVYKYLNFGLCSELVEIRALLICRYYDVDDVYYNCYKILLFSVFVFGDINIYFLTCILKCIFNNYMYIDICVGERGGELREAGWKHEWKVTSQRLL